MAKSLKKKSAQPAPRLKTARKSKKPRGGAPLTDRPLSDSSARPSPSAGAGPCPAVLDRLFAVVMERRHADPAVSHSARLLSRGVAKVAQKFGEEAVECLIEAVARNHDALVAESADVLYHLIVLWVAAGVHPDEVWAELGRREGISGIAEKNSRTDTLAVALRPATTKIP